MLGTPYAIQVQPLSAELQKSLNIKEATDLRDRLCNLWGIVSHSHKTHGANFSGSQTLVNLIKNIVEPLKSHEHERVRLLVMREYHYDITTQMMV